jgi:hypothetical protein
VFIPLKKAQSQSQDQLNATARAIRNKISQHGYDLIDYQKGIAQKKDTKQNIKIGKLLNKLREVELLQQFINDKTREGSKEDNYIVVISRHPYDIAGMSTDRGWTSCMNLDTGSNRIYVPLEIKAGSLVAYVTKATDPDLKNPTGRLMIKPFVNVMDQNSVDFGIESQVYGTAVPGFVEAVSAWVEEVNSRNKLDQVVIFKLDPNVYNDGINDTKRIRGGNTKEDERAAEILKKLLSGSLRIDKIENPSELMQIVAVQNNGRAIRYIKNPSEKVQLAAVNDGGYALQYIDNPSEKVQMAALNKSISAIQYIDNPSEKVQMAAVQIDGFAIQFIENPSERVQVAAVNNNKYALMYINNPSERVQLAAVKHSAYVLKYIKNPSERVQLAAVKHDGYALQYIDNPSEKVQMAAVKSDGSAIHYIDNPSEKVQMAAVQHNGRAIQYINNPSERVQVAAVKDDRVALQYIGNPSERVQVAAVKADEFALHYIDNPSERVRLAAKKHEQDKQLNLKFL